MRPTSSTWTLSLDNSGWTVRTRKLKRSRRENWCLWLQTADAVWLQQRPDSGIWAGLWTWPLLDQAAIVAVRGWAFEPGRRAGVAIVQPHDIDTAVGEVRWVREHGLASVIFSLEMSRNEIVMRLLSAEAQVSEQPALAATLSSAQSALEQAAEAGAGHDTHDVAREYVAQAMDDFVATATNPVGRMFAVSLRKKW